VGVTVAVSYRTGSLQRDLCDLFEVRFGHSPNTRTAEELAKTVTEISAGCGFSSMAEYLTLLRTLPIEAPMVQALLQTVTNNESYFFRDPTSMDSLRQHVLPPLIRRAAESRRLRVWSAGCSTGEEIYSISILLRELIPDVDFWDIALVGSDIDAAAIARARRGHYKSWSLRVTGEAERSRYFTRETGGDFVLRKRFRSNVDFCLHNLVDPEAPVPLPEEFDLILCRNVAIYLHEQARMVLAKKFASALARGGVWVSGPSDPLPSAFFESRVLPGLLEHRMATTVPAKPLEVANKNSLHPVDSRPSLRLDPGEVSMDYGDESDTVPTWVPSTEDESERPTWTPPPDRSRPAAEPPPSSGHVGGVDQALDSGAVLDAARGMADRGEMQAALELVDRVVASDPLEPNAYLLRSHLLETLGHNSAAESDLRRVTYLDPTRGEAYLRLGLLHVREGRKEAAVKALRNALVLGDQEGGSRDTELRQIAALNLMRAMREEVSP